MNRYAIYARFSSENQNEKSVDDQIRECRKKIESLGGTLADGHIFADYAISGSHTATRPGINALMDAARRSQFDAVIAEDLSRLSRDQEDIAGIYKRLSYVDIKLITLLEGQVDEMHIGFKGTQNAMHLKQLGHSVRRGQKGRVSQGRIPGGNCYGYDMVRELDGRGEIIRGVRKINNEEADIVRRIFKDYAGGKSPRAIAHQLNREGVPGPRGGQWQTSTINGNPRRRNGILNNDLYAGRIVYNRQRFVKDPDTGKRQAKPNAPGEWISHDMPELRIIPEDLWDKSQQRRKEMEHSRLTERRRPKYLFSGLLKCACCGGSYVIISGPRRAEERRYGCSTRKEKGTCDNARSIAMHHIEDRVFNGLRRYLAEPKGLRLFVQEFHRHLREARADVTREKARAEKTVGQIDRKIKGIIQAIEDGLYSPDMKQRMADLQAEKAQLLADIDQDAADDQVVDFLPTVGAAYEKYIDSLKHALALEGTKETATALLRSMIERIVLRPRAAGEGLDIEIDGRLASILHFIQGNTEPLKYSLGGTGAISMVAGKRSGLNSGAMSMVAGVGFEPTTFRL